MASEPWKRRRYLVHIIDMLGQHPPTHPSASSFGLMAFTSPRSCTSITSAEMSLACCRNRCMHAHVAAR